MKKIIVDTDLGYDVDDAAALAVISLLHKKKAVDFCAATHCFSAPTAADAVAWINGYYGLTVPVGLAEDKPDQKCLERFIKKLSLSSRGVYPTAVQVLKTALLDCENGEATLLCIGQLNNLRDLLADEEGARLVTTKVREIVVMGGNFAPYGEYYEHGGVRWKGEFNIVTDLTAAQEVVSHTDLPLSFVDFNQGVDVELNVDELFLPENNPVDRIYRLARWTRRSAWDIVAALYACGGYEAYFDRSSFGAVRVDGNGRTTFAEGLGRHRLVSLRHSDHSVFEEVIRKFFLENR